MRNYAAAPGESLGMSHLPLTDKYLHALRAVARGEVFRTYNRPLQQQATLVALPYGPHCRSARGSLVQGCHRMLLTVQGLEALRDAEQS